MLGPVPKEFVFTKKHCEHLASLYAHIRESERERERERESNM